MAAFDQPEFQIKNPFNDEEVEPCDGDATPNNEDRDDSQLDDPASPPPTSIFDPETAILTSAHQNTIVHDEVYQVLFDPHELSRLYAAIHSTDRRLQLAATCHIRKLLAIQPNPISQVIRSGVIPRLVHFLQLKEDPALQYEACWVLSNVASGTKSHTDVVVRAGALPYLVALLSSDNLDVKEQAVWALSNIAGDSTAHRDAVLGAHALEPLIECLYAALRSTTLRSATRAISALCRGTPPPPFSQVWPALPALSRLVFSVDDEVLSNACWALFEISEGIPEGIQLLVNAGVVRRMVELLAHPRANVAAPAFRAIGKVLTGDEKEAQAVIDADGIPALVELLYSLNKGTTKDACWALSNITAGNSAQLESVFEAGAIKPLVRLLSAGDPLSSDDFEIRREAGWALANACAGGNDRQVHQMVRYNCIAPMVEMLSVHDPDLTLSLLDAFGRILGAGANLTENEKGRDKKNPYARQVERAAGIDKLELLTRCENEEIIDKASQLLRGHFDGTSG